MLNSKVEKCPNCGKIKSIFKACTHCGFKQEPWGDSSEAKCVENINLKSYFISFVFEKGDSFAFGNATVTDASTITVRNIASLQEQLKSELNADKVTILNFIEI